MAKKSKGTAAPTFGGLQRKSDTIEFTPDYSNVKRDLKRIGMLAGSLFVIMIALSFFIK